MANKTTGQTLITIGGAVIGGLVGGPQGVLIGASIGYSVGTLVDPPDNSSGNMATAASYPIQRSNKATPITIVYGTIRIAGNILWMGENHPWQTSSSSSGGKGGGGGGSSTITGSGNRRSFLIGVCEGPVTISKIWKGKELLLLSDVTVFNGDGSDNTGIEDLIGENFANYPHTCCVFFNEFEIGAGGTLPNFTFEVGGRTLGFANIIYAGNGRCQVLDENYQIIRSEGPSALSCDLNIRGDYAWCGTTTVGNNPINLRDKNGVDLGITFEEPTIPKNGNWNCLRFSMDGNFLYANLNAVSGDNTLIKWDVLTGAKIWEVTPPENNSAPGKFSLDINENIYFPRTFPPTGSDQFDSIGVYDKDGNFGSGWNGVYGQLYSTIDQRIGDEGTGYFVGNKVDFGAFDLAWALDLDTGTFTSQDFGNTTFTIGGRNVTSNGTYVYVFISVAVNGKNLFQCSSDLQTIHNSIFLAPALGSAISALLINKKNQLCVFFTNSEFGNTNQIIVFDENLNRLENHTNTPAALGGVATTDAVQIPKIILASSIDDENPALIIKDLLTNTRYGAGLDEDTWIDTDSFDATEIYCNENGLRFSFAITRQKPIVDWIDFINSHFQGFVHMSEGKIVLDVYKENPSVFEITRDNLIIDTGENPDPPVLIKKLAASEIINRVEVSYTNRSAGYDISVAIAMDESDQRASGKVKKKTIQLTGITNGDLAQKIALRVLYEYSYRYSSYNFNVGYKDMLLEIGDVGTITDGFLLTDEIIRITSIEEIKNGKELAIQAVEDSPFLYEIFTQNIQDTKRIPDSPPTLVDASATFTESLVERGFAISIAPGGEDTNGWQIYKSNDDITYSFIGNAYIDDPAASPTNSTGTTISALPSHKTGPVYAGQESILVNIGTITVLDTAISDEQFFNNKRLCKISDEIIAYKNCEQTAIVGIWKITGLIRGLFGTEAVAHTIGETFWTINNDFSFGYADSDIGTTIYFKFLTLHGSSIQGLSEVPAIPYLVQGNYKRPMPVGLIRIHDRGALTTYIKDDLIIDFFFASKTAGFNLGGHGNILWGSYEEDISITSLNVILKQLDDTEILNEVFIKGDIGTPLAILIEDVDRDGNNPYIVEINPGGLYSSIGSRELQVEKV